LGKIGVAKAEVGSMREQVSDLKHKVDVLIVSLHQGIEYALCVDRRSRKVARLLAEAGADCIVCHHTHVVQAIEMCGDVPVFYGIGNFIIDREIAKEPAAQKTLALRILLCAGEIHRVVIEPFAITDALQTQPLVGREQEELRRDVEALTAMLDSRWGTLRSYASCGWIKARRSAAAVLDMWRREGFITTAGYYLGRLRAKLSN